MAAGYVLDTNILLQLARGGALGERIDRQYQLRQSLAQCVICIVTVGEAKSLVMQFGWGEAKRLEMESLIESVTAVDISDPLVLDAYAAIDHYGRSGVKPARPMGKNDVWIAAVAHVSGLTLLTTDKDFDHLDPTFLRRDWIDPNLAASKP